jgi:HEPN domain-containing protein
MQPDAEWWVRAGERDLAMAVDLDRLQYHEGAAFHCQQAAEKLLKALLVRARFGLTAPGPLVTAVRRLDRHYVDSRYPNGVGGAPDRFYDATITAEAIRDAQDVAAFVRGHLT